MPKYLNNVDLSQNELQNAKLHPLAAAPSTPSESQVYYDTVLKMIRFWNGSAWINVRAADADFHTLTLEGSTENSDEIVIWDASASTYKRQTKASFISGTGGEANTGSNQGTDGVGVFDDKSGVELQFRNIAPASSKVTVALNGKDIDVDIAPGNIDHSALNDDEAAKHRTINDGGTLATELWSASKINTELAGKSDTGHNHSGVYEPVDATIIREADIDDTPVDSATTAPVSSNWAYDHANASNPHSVSKSDVGLGNVTNEAQIPLSQKGAVSGVAELDGSGKVPSAQLPAYVDDVEEYANFAALPGTGETGKIYVTLDDNKTFRWTGSVYTEISASLALGNTSGTAYRGDYGEIAYNHSQAAHAPSNAEANVNADWNAGSGDAQILNKPTILDASDITFENLDTNGDVGTGSSQVAAGDHSHSEHPTKYATDVGNGALTSISVTHSLGTRDVTVMVRENSGSYAQVFPDVEMTDTNTVTLVFASAPTSAQYRVIVIG